MAKAKKNEPAIASDFEGGVENTDLDKYIENVMQEYGSYVVENRAIPDIRDGLKPVHRAILWSMYDLKLHYKSGYKKAARTVGDVIGRFHPHGDQAAYGAMVTLANSVPNLVDGYGNWGDHVNNAAAYRYTEARLSEIADKFLLDPDYLQVVPFVDNFSGDTRWPLFLPAKLPILLLVGSPTVPAYGISAGTPPFTIKSVLKLVTMALEGKTITPKLCAKHLQFNFPYGGKCISSEQELVTFFENGKGSVKFEPEYEVDYDENEFHILSAAPGFMSETGINKKLQAISEMTAVSGVSDQGGDEASKYGIKYVIKFKRMVEEAIDDAVDAILKKITGSHSFDVGYTHRKTDGTVFGRKTIPSIIHSWVKYREALENRVLKMLIGKEEDKLEKQKLLLFAVDNVDAIFESLRTKDPDAYLMDKLDKPADFVKSLLDLPVRRLAKLNRNSVKQRMTDIKKDIAYYKDEMKNLPVRIVGQLKTVNSEYANKTNDKL